MMDFVLERIAANMEVVAAKLEEFSKMYDAGTPAEFPWTAAGLRHEASVLRGEE